MDVAREVCPALPAAARRGDPRHRLAAAAVGVVVASYHVPGQTSKVLPPTGTSHALHVVPVSEECKVSSFTGETGEALPGRADRVQVKLVTVLQWLIRIAQVAAADEEPVTEDLDGGGVAAGDVGDPVVHAGELVCRHHIHLALR